MTTVQAHSDTIIPPTNGHRVRQASGRAPRIHETAIGEQLRAARNAAQERLKELDEERADLLELLGETTSKTIRAPIITRADKPIKTRKEKAPRTSGLPARIMAALAESLNGNTSGELVTACGAAPLAVAGALNGLYKKNKITRSGMRGKYIWAVV